MKNKKWKMPDKQTIISGIQGFLIVYMIIMGFIHTYVQIWFAIDSLPREPWVFVVCVAAGLMSVFGLFEWVTHSNTKEVSKKDMCESATSICNGNCETCAWHE